MQIRNLCLVTAHDLIYELGPPIARGIGSDTCISNTGDQVLYPHTFGLQPLKASDISGGNEVASSAAIFMNVLQNKGTEAQLQVVCANAAMAIATVLECTPKEGLEKAIESLSSGKALKAFSTLKNWSTKQIKLFGYIKSIPKKFI